VQKHELMNIEEGLVLCWCYTCRLQL